MRAGRLNRRITIQGKIETQSESGEPITTWGDLGTIWAELINLPGSERFALAQLVGRSLATFRIRYSSVTRQLTTEHRIIMDARQYDITDVRETRKREELQVDCFTPSEIPVTPA